MQECGLDATLLLDPVGPDPSAPPATDVIPSPFVCRAISPPARSSCPQRLRAESLINADFVGPAGFVYPASLQQIAAFPGYVWTLFGGLRLQSSYIATST